MEIPKSLAGVCPLLAGMEIPTVTLAAEDGTDFNLDHAVRQKAAVLVFYRGSWVTALQQAVGSTA